MNLTDKEKQQLIYSVLYLIDSKHEMIRANRALLTDAEVTLMRDNTSEFINLIEKIK